MGKRLKASITYEVEILINEDNDAVKEYESEKEMMLECASYMYGKVLPVIDEGGVVLLDVTLEDFTEL